MKYFLVVALALVASVASSQWTETPSNPFVVADNGNAQVQPKIAPTSDGGCYVGWFDNATGGYDVYLQRLDRHGNELWPHQGVLIADRSVSSTQDWDLDLDSFGNALITFNDDRLGNAICINKVNSGGVLLWGATGVQFNSAGFLGFPRVSELSDGTIGVGFSVDNSLSWRRLDISGNLLGTWTASETGKPYTLCDLVPGDNASMILLYIRRFNTMGNSAKALWTQRYDTNGTALWTNPVPIYAPTGSPYGSQGGSIQNGAFPAMISDGSGGAVCGWYETGGPRNALVQRVLADGTLALPIHGLPVVTSDATLIRVGCAVAFDSESGSIYASAVETNVAQTLYRTLAQKIGSDGVREWTDAGTSVIASNTNQPSFVQVGVGINNVTVFGLDSRSATTGVVFAAGVSTSGLLKWNNLVSDRDGTGKGRLAYGASKDRFGILAWQDGDFSNSDIHMNRLNEEGYLGSYDEAYPNSLTVVEGSEFSGGIGELILSDDLPASFFNDDSTLGCTLDMTFTINPVPDQILLLDIEGLVQRQGLARSVRIKNINTGNFQVLAGEVASIRDVVRRIEIPTISNYVSPSGASELRVIYGPINDEDPAQDGWLHSLDQVRLLGR